MSKRKPKGATAPAPAIELETVTFVIEAPVEAAPAEATAEVVTAGTRKIEKLREERNGVKRPSAGGLCRAVWDFCAEYTASAGSIPTVAIVKVEAAEQGWNSNNASIEYYQWRKFEGVRGRQPKVDATPAGVEVPSAEA